MNCEVCGTELPHGAMFCGECGRAVGTRARPVEPVEPAPLPVPAPEPAPVVQPAPTPQPEPDSFPQPELWPIPAGAPGPTPVPLPEPAPAPLPEAAPVPEAAPLPEPEVEPEVEQDLPPELDVELPAPPEVAPSVDVRAAALDDVADLEQTLIVPRREQGERFVLQFSTGESVTVFGSGLLGRNPVPQPGEYFDQLVTISDPGKSVSKTHLEFGQEDGSFWVSDRFSGNGSLVREPEAAPRRLLAGKHYRIVRGTRVDIAEQFFIVS